MVFDASRSAQMPTALVGAYEFQEFEGHPRSAELLLPECLRWPTSSAVSMQPRVGFGVSECQSAARRDSNILWSIALRGNTDGLELYRCFVFNVVLLSSGEGIIHCRCGFDLRWKG
jgi:hypothetical protein